MKTELTKLEKTIYNYWIVNDKDESKLIDYIARVIPYDDYNKLKGSFSDDKTKKLIKKFKAIEVDTYTVSKDFILEAHESACSTWKAKIENEFKELFPKFELEVGKWYKHEYYDYDYLINYQGNGFGYGFFNGVYSNGWGFGEQRTSQGAKPATKEEVQTALIAEAKRRGYRNGVTFKSLDYNFKNVKIIDDFFKFDFNNNDLYLKVDAPSGQRYRSVFLNGKWAEIISEPIELTLEQIAEKFGVEVEQIKNKK